MSNTTAGTVWNLPNYLGELYTASRIQTPVLTMIGGLNGAKQSDNFEFPVAQTYDHETASQPAITETASLSAPTVISYVRQQDKNTCQIHHEQVSISYSKASQSGRLSMAGTDEVLTAGVPKVVVSEKDFQIGRALEKCARDAEYSFIQGSYQAATSASVAAKTRGLNDAATSTLAAGGARLSKPSVQYVLKTMFDNGAVFANVVIVVNAFQKQMFSEIYGYAPTDRNVGGVNIKQIETDFGSFGIVLDAFQSTSVVGIFDLSVVSVVACPVPNKGVLFYEELARTGASEKGQVYGQIGLDHGPGFMHGTITGLATS